MKRILLALVLGFVITTGASAQSFFESFESGMTNIPGVISPTFVNISLSSGTWRYAQFGTPIGLTGLFDEPNSTTIFNQPAVDGVDIACMNFNAVAGTATIDSWLLSPVVTLHNGDTFSFFTRTVNSPAFPDRLIARYSTNGASENTADFSNILVDINSGLTLAGYPNQWTQFSFNLSGLGGPTAGRFAFNYFVPGGGPTGANSDIIGIDAVNFSTAAVPEPATIAFLGLGALSAFPVYRRWRRNNKKVAAASQRFAKQ